jgi:hypothetical protein
MPQGLKRYYGAGHFHFITCSCYQCRAWLGTPRRRDLFLRILEQTRQKYRFVVLGYVIMDGWPTHLLRNLGNMGFPDGPLESKDTAAVGVSLRIPNRLAWSYLMGFLP